LHIRWQGGAIGTIELGLSPNRAEAVRYPDALVAHSRALAATHDDDEIVALLNRNGLKSSTGRRFTVSMIRWIRHKHHIPSPNRLRIPSSIGKLTLWRVHRRSPT
jgi:hypothetical protein